MKFGSGTINCSGTLRVYYQDPVLVERIRKLVQEEERSMKKKSKVPPVIEVLWSAPVWKKRKYRVEVFRSGRYFNHRVRERRNGNVLDSSTSQLYSRKAKTISIAKNMAKDAGWDLVLV